MEPHPACSCGALDDGTIRLYRLPDTKVCKAIRGLGTEVSSIAFGSPATSSVWLAVGQHVRHTGPDYATVQQSVSDILLQFDHRQAGPVFG